MIELRPYQKQAVSKLLWSAKQNFEGADLVVLPTGAGKSIVIAEFAKELNEDVLILQPSKEILTQNLSKLLLYVPGTQVGVYSASMKQKTINRYTFATIQSIYKKPEYFKHFKYILIDECHLVNPKNLEGMFTSFLDAIGSPRVFGFTATPYRRAVMYERLEDGSLLTHQTTKIITRVKEFFWRRVLFNVNNIELVKEGYLVPMRYIDKSIVKHEDIRTNITGSDFDLESFATQIAPQTKKIIETIYFAQEISKSILVFCASVEQAEEYSTLVEGSAVVSAKTKPKERDRIIADFKSGAIKIVFNMGVLTTGFDHPSLDCVVLIRPTQSIGLYYQMLGRGVRLAEGKTRCNVIDLTGTVDKMGRIETILFDRIDGKWELTTEKGSWHNRSLYSFRVQPKEVDPNSNPFLD